MRSSKILLVCLLLGIGGWATLRYYRQQQRLYQQLAHLTAVLATENDQVAQEASNAVKSIDKTVKDNRNQPADVALLRRAEALHDCIKRLTDTLRTWDNLLRRATGNPLAPAQLRQFNTAAGQAVSTIRRQALRQQLATCADTLRQLSAAETTPFAEPVFKKNTSVIEALASLTQVEGMLLTRQELLLKRISKSLTNRHLLPSLLLTATAESNIVAPGDTYRARLLVSQVIYNPATSRPTLYMTCNGRPVPVDSNGIGQVHFRASASPGPATWTGSIRTNYFWYYGGYEKFARDSTFRVTVPYRVARR